MSTLNQQPRTALATGATSGLGKDIALRLARDGMQVIIVGRDAARGAAVVDQIAVAGGEARFIAAELNDPADIKHLAEEAGDIDVLVNNAGLSVWAPTEAMNVADFDSIFASNVRAPFLLVGAFAPAMAERGASSIIKISSSARRHDMGETSEPEPGDSPEDEVFWQRPDPPSMDDLCGRCGWRGKVYLRAECA